MDARQVTTNAQKEALSIVKDPIISQLTEKSHDEIDKWVDQNVRTMEDLQAIVKKILYIVKSVTLK